MSLGDTQTVGPENGAPSNGNNLGLTDPADADVLKQVQDVLTSEVLRRCLATPDNLEERALLTIARRSEFLLCSTG
jgi:hypothetical protein